MDGMHRDDMAPPETPAQVFHRHRKAWPMIGVASVVGAAVLMQLTGWGL